jgi:hypothetical protein
MFLMKREKYAEADPLLRRSLKLLQANLGKENILRARSPHRAAARSKNTTENLISTGYPATAAQPMAATKRHKNRFVVGGEFNSRK